MIRGIHLHRKQVGIYVSLKCLTFIFSGHLSSQTVARTICRRTNVYHFRGLVTPPVKPDILEGPAKPTPAVITPPIYLRPSRWRRFLQSLGRVTLVSVIGLSGTFYYLTQKDRHPGVQLPHDPLKKTVVVLGSGWGATSFLKGLDTTDYNVIVISPKNFFLFTREYLRHWER